MSTSFENDAGSYEYTVHDKLQQDTLPPSAIQITKVPAHGKILTKGHDGATRELKVGDIVPTDAMKNFSYDQGKTPCTKATSARCKDSFDYTTMSSWVGKGVEAEAGITLTPKQIEAAQPKLQDLEETTEEAALPSFEVPLMD